MRKASIKEIRGARRNRLTYRGRVILSSRVNSPIGWAEDVRAFATGWNSACRPGQEIRLYEEVR